MNCISLNGQNVMYWPTNGQIGVQAKFGDRGLLVKHKSPTTKERYIRVVIGGKKYRAHHLAFMCMLNDPLWELPEGYEVDHVDGNRLNNAWPNLELVTKQENIRRYNVSKRTKR